MKTVTHLIFSDGGDRIKHASAWSIGDNEQDCLDAAKLVLALFHDRYQDGVFVRLVPEAISEMDFRTKKRMWKAETRFSFVTDGRKIPSVEPDDGDAAPITFGQVECRP